MKIRQVTVVDATDQPRDHFAPGEEIRVRMRIEADDPHRQVHALIGVSRAADDMQCFIVATREDGMTPLSGRRAYELTVRLLDVPLTRGEYAIAAFVGDEHAITVFDRHDLQPGFSITGENYQVGMITVDHRWDVASERIERAAAELR